MTSVPDAQRRTAAEDGDGRLGVLREVEQRVLWLSTAIVDHANRVRPNPSGLKVGGHQASSASMVSIMTSLWFDQLRAERPGVGQAARLAGAARDQLPARRAGRVVPDHAARVRRPAELPEPVQGPGPGRLLDRLGGHRRDRPDLGCAGPPLRQHPVRRGGHRAAVLAGRRRRARRGRGLGGRARPDGRRAGRGRLDRRPQPAVAGPGGPHHRRDPAAGHVRRRGLAGAHRQVRPPARGAVRPARRRARCAAGSTRCPTRSTSGCCAARPPSCATGCPATGRRRRDHGAARRRVPTRTCTRRSATSAATTSPRCATRSRRSTTPGRR